ncbi:hypothetical protein [Cyanobium sp. NS01]|nr:hypothetical protein [Cyanobium sp. NS01]
MISNTWGGLRWGGSAPERGGLGGTGREDGAGELLPDPAIGAAAERSTL